MRHFSDTEYGVSWLYVAIFWECADQDLGGRSLHSPHSLRHHRTFHVTHCLCDYHFPGHHLCIILNINRPQKMIFAATSRIFSSFQTGVFFFSRNTCRLTTLNMKVTCGCSVWRIQDVAQKSRLHLQLCEFRSVQSIFQAS
jgi:hypothetical protein